MAEGENKRMVKKIKNDNRTNIKVSTQDKTLLSKDNNVNINIDGQTKNKKNNILKNDTETKEDTIDVRISKLIEKNKQSQIEVDTIKTNIREQSEKELADLLSLNKQISDLEKEQIKASNENRKLLAKFKEMEEEVSNRFDNKFKISKLFKSQKNNENIRNLDNEIKAKEKQKTIVQKDIKYEKKEIKKLENLLEKEGDEQKLKEELKEINENIKKIKIEIEELKKIKMEHKICQKNLNLLKSKFNVVENDIEFESKKSNMIETEKKEPTVIKNVNMTMEFGESVRNKLLKSTKNKYNSKMKIVNYKSYNFLLDDTKNEKEGRNQSHKTLNDKNTQKSLYMDISDYYSLLKNEISCKIDTKTPKSYLFTEQESNILKKILPTEYYNNCNEKYNKIENQITEIGDKFKEHDQIKKDIYFNNIRYDEINLKLKQAAKIKAKLSVDASKNNKKLVDLKRTIKVVKNEIERQQIIITKKIKDKNLLKKRIDVLKKSKMLQTED
jgi:hypothetical protein